MEARQGEALCSYWLRIVRDQRRRAKARRLEVVMTAITIELDKSLQSRLVGGLGASDEILRLIVEAGVLPPGAAIKATSEMGWCGPALRFGRRKGCMEYTFETVTGERVVAEVRGGRSGVMLVRSES